MSEPNYHTTKHLAIKMKKKTNVKIRSVYQGLFILDMSKIVMHEYWYDYVEPQHGESRSWPFGLNRDIEEASVADDATKKKRNRRPTMKGKEYQLST